jgi:hypothetical protein
MRTRRTHHLSTFPTSQDSLRGEALPPAVLSAMQSMFCAELDPVRVYPQSSFAESLGARAFACGDAIHFAPGEYHPESAEGWRVIGHELTHVLQQRHGYVHAAVVNSMVVVDDPELEHEAEVAGTCAMALHGGVAPTRKFRWDRRRKAAQRGFAIQCLKGVDDFRRDTRAMGPRNNILSVDDKLTEFHRVQGPLTGVPLELYKYKAQLRSINELLDACLSYQGSRTPGVLRLVNEIQPLKRFLELVIHAMDGDNHLEQLDSLDQAFELTDRMGTPDWVIRKDQVRNIFATLEPNFGEVSQQARLVGEHDARMLMKLRDVPQMPDTLRAIIEEGVHATTQAQVDHAFNMAGFSHKNDGFEWKMKLNQGRIYRLGQAIHELTHLSTAVKFGWHKLMLCAPLDAQDNELKAFAGLRYGKLTPLLDLIAGSDLSGDWKEVFTGQVKYATTSSAFTKVLSVFKPQIGEQQYQRFDRLTKSGVHSELHEYDTVVNQMALWCFLLGKRPGYALYDRLLELARQAYLWRAKYNNGAGGTPSRTGLVRKFVG